MSAMTLDDLIAKVKDPYERTARLYPALLALMPLLVMVMLLYGSKATALTGAVTIAVSCGGLYLTTNLCRELGKRLEDKLYLKWGGKPTTQLLRHRDKTIEAVTKRQVSFLSCCQNQRSVSRQRRRSERSPRCGRRSTSREFDGFSTTLDRTVGRIST